MLTKSSVTVDTLSTGYGSFPRRNSTVPGIGRRGKLPNASVRREGNMDPDSFFLETFTMQYYGRYPPSGGHGPPGLPGGRDGAGKSLHGVMS